MSSPEDAAKAYALSMKHSEAGNLEGALKWARKAIAIDPTLSKAKVLLTSLEKGHMPGKSQASSSSSSAQPANGSASAGEGMRKRASEKSEPAAAPKREFTKEQARVVAQVNKAGKEHDYYAVLLLKKEDKPDDNAIKKGYRKVSVGELDGSILMGPTNTSLSAAGVTTSSR
jgi:hypothetical protein